jgi:hypothetical protein
MVRFGVMNRLFPGMRCVSMRCPMQVLGPLPPLLKGIRYLTPKVRVLPKRGSLLVSLWIHLQRIQARIPLPQNRLLRRDMSLCGNVQFESVVLLRGTLPLGLSRAARTPQQ